MAYYTDDLIDEVIELSKDSSLPRSRVLGYIQRTQDAVLGRRRFRFNEHRLVQTLTISTTTYSYDDDHQQVIQIVLSHAALETPLQPEYLAPDEFFERFPLPETETAGAPRYYTDFERKIHWNCPLDRGYTLGMRYLVAPTRLEDSDASSPDIPVEFKDILLKGALASVEQFRENFDIAAVYKREVEDLESDMIARYGLRKMQPGKARTVRRRETTW